MVEQVIKLRPVDKKRLGTKYNFIYRTPSGARGFKTLTELNKFLGLSKRIGYKQSSFKGLKPATK